MGGLRGEYESGYSWGRPKYKYNLIFPRIFNDIPFIGYYRLEDIPF